MKRTLFAITACATTLTFGGDILQWQSNRITGLYGTGFEVDRNERKKSSGEGNPSDHAPVIATLE